MTLIFKSQSEADTARLAQRMASLVHQGEAVLLEGDVGAGKSFFARALIQSLQDHPEEVPSPTFTLVQVYETRKGDVWHADLYRLSGPDEAADLGLLDAMDTSICLIEWPDRLGNDRPATANVLTFEMLPAPEARKLTLRGPLCARLTEDINA